MFTWPSEHRPRRSGSFSSDDSRPVEGDNRPIPPPVLVYHESARSIVFRDHLRRAKRQFKSSSSSNLDDDKNTSDEAVKIVNYTPTIQPLEPLELTARDEFAPLLQSRDDANADDDWNEAERQVVQLFQDQRACVKTLKNNDWTAFLQRFWKPVLKHDDRYPDVHDDIPPHGDNHLYNAFVTSTTLLPQGGQKMRAYGSTKEYTTGVVFGLPNYNTERDETDAVQRAQTWAWPCGYAAKTEFNIDSRGNLINGRKEALVSLEELRRNNHDYVHKKDYKLLGRVVKGGLQTVPYNEVFLRVGGVGRLVNGMDVVGRGSTMKPSLEYGVGLPVAFFVRTASYGHLITLLRTRARAAHVLGQEAMADTPLLFLTPEHGVRVLTRHMQEELLQIAARNLNPFQNPAISYRTTIENTVDAELQQKMEELIDLDSDIMRQTLTPEERARLAGGFGGTDESTVKLLMEAKRKDSYDSGNSSKSAPRDHHDHHLQDIVNEGLASAVRSGDYHTARQLLILYSLVSNNSDEIEEVLDTEDNDSAPCENDLKQHAAVMNSKERHSFCDAIVRQESNGQLAKHTIVAPPPPPPLDTDRLRSATNSDGLLAVLGAAQVLKAMRDGGAKKRVAECVSAINEWVDYGQNSVAFRLASWRDQHAAQADLKIAMEQNSSFMAFVSNKAVTNRKNFANKLQTAVSSTDFCSVQFLGAIHEIVHHMHSPCLRLELLQFILGLDNRFSIAHLERSVELAATCLSITTVASTTR